MEVAKETKSGSLGDGDDARPSNTHIAQRKCAIPHSMMKNNRNIIACCNNTRQGAPHTGKQTIRTHTRENLQNLQKGAAHAQPEACASYVSDRSHVNCT